MTPAVSTSPEVSSASGLPLVSPGDASECYSLGYSVSPLPAPNRSLVYSPESARHAPFSDLFGSDDEEAPTSTSPLNSPESSAPQMSPSSPETDTDGSSYFNFFLSEISNCFPYVNLFPWTAATLFSTSSHHPALRQSVLSVAALIADTESGEGKRRALRHLEKALQLLQSKITTVAIDEGVAISSFLLAHISVMLGEPANARKHLRGKLMVLHQLDPRHVLQEETVPSPLTNNPLTLLIWRMAIRIDFIASIACGRTPVLPPYVLL
jgi:hypothetical protein